MSERIRRRCMKHGHKWRPTVANVVGTDCCARIGCDAIRTNPMALPPEPWPPRRDL